jgi:glutathionylspermidine synthase
MTAAAPPNDALDLRAYDAFARALIEDGVLTDPWQDGRPRFDPEPIVLPSARAALLAEAARDVAEVWDEAVRIAADDPALQDDFFGLTPVQKIMFEASQPLWHGIARADVFFTEGGGLAVTELNCDTPTGEAEACVLGGLASAARPGLLDPNAELADRFVEMLEALRGALAGPSAPRTVGIVYPTELTEDLSLVRLYKRWLEARGHTVALGSPYNLRRVPGEASVRLFEEPIGLLIRHYKTDWWSERASAWDDEQLLDAAPLAGPLHAALSAQAEGGTAIVNPFGAVVAQNKRTMALMWEHIHRFSLRAQDAIQRLVPVTMRLEAVHPEMLRTRREDWVLKSDYGAEGEEVVIGALVTEAIWAESLAHARRGRWVAQRRFDAERDDQGRTTNLGVFLLGGEPAGLYARRGPPGTDAAALSVPVLLDPS